MFPCRISSRASTSPSTSINCRAAAVTLRRDLPVTPKKWKRSRVSVTNVSRGYADRPTAEHSFHSRLVRRGLRNPGINREEQLLFPRWSRQFLKALDHFHAANTNIGSDKRFCSGTVWLLCVETPSFLATHSLFLGVAFEEISALSSNRHL